MSEELIRLEQKLSNKLDGISKQTTDTSTDVKLLAQAIQNNDKIFAKFEDKTEAQMTDVFSRLEVMEQRYAAGTADRAIMAEARKSFIKWLVVSMCSLVVTFGGGIALLMTQISQISP